jgi:hypothetical protein
MESCSDDPEQDIGPAGCRCACRLYGMGSCPDGSVFLIVVEGVVLLLAACATSPIPPGHNSQSVVTRALFPFVSHTEHVLVRALVGSAGSTLPCTCGAATLDASGYPE